MGGRPSAPSLRSPASARRWPRRPAWPTDVPTLSLERWRRPDLFWTLLREARDRPRLSLVRPEMPSTRCPPSTPELPERSAALRALSTPSMPRLTTCSTRPRTPRRRPRRPWLMPPDLLMSSDLSRTTQALCPRPRGHSRPSLENWCAEANDAAMRGGRAALAKLETRIRELEIEL